VRLLLNAEFSLFFLYYLLIMI